jgi:adenine C2-methylase RlmN of 23S rRNA A2503 and tRNA A37
LFKAQLDEAGVPATIRLTRGRDIAAACGQLATPSRARNRAHQDKVRIVHSLPDAVLE